MDRRLLLLWKYLNKKKKYILFLTIATYFITFFIISPLYISVDDSFYCDLARHLTNDHAYICNFGETSNPPGLPYLLSFFMFFFSEEISIKIVISLSLFLLFYGIYFLGKEVYNEKCGYLAAFLTMTMPLIPMHSLRILTDVPFLSFSVLMMLFYVKIIKNDDRNKNLLYSVILGAFMWISFSIRNTGITFIEMMFFFSFCLYIFKKNKSIFYLMLSSLIFLSFFLIKIPGNSLEYIKSLILAFLGKGSVGSVGYNRLYEFYGFIVESIIKKLNQINAPIQFIYFTVINFMLLRWIFLPAMIVFIYKLYKNFKERREFEILLVLWVLIFVSFYTFVFHAFIRPRDLIPVIPPFMILFSIYLIENVGKKKVAVILLAIHLIASPFMIYRSVDYVAGYKTETYIDACEWLNENSSAGDIFVSMGISSRIIHYYTERKVYSFDNQDKDFFLEDSIKYFIVSNYQENEYDWDYLKENLTLIKRYEDDKFFVEIYEVKI